MKKSSKVYKLFINYEKEEKWLNEMSGKGFNLVNYTWGCYRFEKGRPGEYVYRIELLKELPNHPESEDYIEFLSDSGIEHVTSYARWAYFRRKADQGAFNLYSDYDSRIQHHQRIAVMMGIIMMSNLVSGITMLNWRMSNGKEFPLYISTLNLIVALLLATIVISQYLRISQLKKEREIHE